jgi:hypothetical protein
MLSGRESMPPVSFNDRQLAEVGAIARSVPIALRFVYLNMVADMLPVPYTDEDVRRVALRAAYQVNVAACSQQEQPARHLRVVR